MRRGLSVSPVEQEMLDMIVAAARMGGKCPSNRAIADRINCDSGSVSNMLRRLENKGVVKVERSYGKRIVTVVATGARTAGTLPPARPLSDAPKPAPRAPIVIEREDPVYAEPRDPCIRCGVRYDLHAELGCKRWRAA